VPFPLERRERRLVPASRPPHLFIAADLLSDLLLFFGHRAPRLMIGAGRDDAHHTARAVYLDSRAVGLVA
jgi:hypothetical protein